MGKKTVGGGYQKNHAKSNNAPQSTSSKLRVVEEEGEIYAVVMKILGGGMCHVECIDGKKRLCHFRGKFSGKNKRQNEITPNTWVIVGTRDWEPDKSLITVGKKDQLNNCDLLEVYSDHQKKQLCAMPKESWHMLIKHDTSLGVADRAGCVGAEDPVAFRSEASVEYDQLMKGFVGSATLALGVGTEADSLEQLWLDVADI